MNERVTKREDGILLFPLGGDCQDEIVDIHERGAAAGLDDFEIAELVQEYLEGKYLRSLN